MTAATQLSIAMTCSNKKPVLFGINNLLLHYGRSRLNLLSRFQRVIFAKGRGSQGLGSDMKPKEVKARDVPVRVRGRVVPVAVETPIVRTVVRVAAKLEATHQPTGTLLLLSLKIICR